jgi:hypothetical protein
MVIFLSQTESTPKYFFRKKKKHCSYQTSAKLLTVYKIQTYIHAPKKSWPFTVLIFKKLIIKSLWASPVPNVIWTGQQIYKIGTKFHLWPWTLYFFHCTDFHDITPVHWYYGEIFCIRFYSNQSSNMEIMGNSCTALRAGGKSMHWILSKFTLSASLSPGFTFSRMSNTAVILCQEWKNLF